MKLLKITIYKSEDEIVRFLNNTPKDLKTELFYLENEIIDVSIVGIGYCVIFTSVNQHQEVKLIDLYKRIGLPIKIEDLTNQAITGFYNTIDKDVIKARSTEWKFNELISDFILKNASVDDVLDKISLHGIGSLLEADYKILQKI